MKPDGAVLYRANPRLSIKARQNDSGWSPLGAVATRTSQRPRFCLANVPRIRWLGKSDRDTSLFAKNCNWGRTETAKLETGVKTGVKTGKLKLETGELGSELGSELGQELELGSGLELGTGVELGSTGVRPATGVRPVSLHLLPYAASFPAWPGSRVSMCPAASTT